MWRFAFLENLSLDLRYGFLLLARSPGFTTVVVLSLALGIGANTAIFSLIDAVMLRMLPVKSPEQLVLLSWAVPKFAGFYQAYSGWGGCPDKPGMASGCSFSYPTFEDIQAQNVVFSEVLAAGLGEVNLMVNGHAGRAETESVSGSYFATLGVRPILGRAITPDDDRPGAAPVAVIGQGLWERRFGHQASVLGKPMNINGATFTIVGVAPARFSGIQPGWRRDLWIPLATLPATGSSRKASTFHDRDNWWVMIIGRLKPGVSKEKARASLDVIFRQGLMAVMKPRLKPEELPHIGLSSASRGMETLRQFYSKPLVILMAVVGLVLLIACANVANLMLARATERQKEIAVRLSLGAGHQRLIRQLLAESALLALLGGAAGILLAYQGSDLLLAIVTAGPIHVDLDVHPGLRVLAFTAAASLLTGILFGLAPALRCTAVDLTPALKASTRSLFRTPGQRGLRLGLGKALVVAQVAISLLLLAGAGLFLRTLTNLENVKLGFNPQHVLLFGVEWSHGVRKDLRKVAFNKDLLARLQALPGVKSVSVSENTLLSGNVSKRSMSVEGYIPTPGEDTSVIVLPVGPRFFETMGIPLILGRPISFQDTDKEREEEAMVAVVNEAMARRYYHGQNPVGREFTWGKGAIQIVGLAGDAKYDDLRQDAPPVVYVPRLFGDKSAAHFELRTLNDPKALLPAVQRVVEQMDSSVLLFDVKTQTGQIDEMLFQEHMFAKLTSAFGLLALVLACVGLYGIMAYAVVRRTSEIGIRMALGAERRSIFRMVMRETLVLVVVGVALGMPVAMAANRLISSILFGLKPSDPTTLAMATAVMLAVAACAGYLPARRASQVDPMVALRNE